MTDALHESWSSALAEEWDACESWAADQAGPAPDASGSVVASESCDETMDAVRSRIAAVGDRDAAQRFSTNTAAKIALRRAALSWVEDPHVLELCCGMGCMWAWCYHGLPYHGVDKERIFSPRLCSMAPAEEWVEENDLAAYNVIDVDTFGSPWQMVGRVLTRSSVVQLSVVVTDGVRAVYQRGGAPDHLARIFGAERGIGIPAGGVQYKEYASMVRAFIADRAEQSGRRVESVLHADNGREGAQTNYWAFRLEAL